MGIQTHFSVWHGIRNIDAQNNKVQLNIREIFMNAEKIRFVIIEQK